MPNKVIQLKCGFTGESWTTSVGTKKQKNRQVWHYLRIDLEALYHGISNTKIIELFTELNKLGYTESNGITLGYGYYDAIDNMWIDFRKVEHIDLPHNHSK